MTIKKEGKLVETEMTFHNKTEMRVMAQIFVGRALISISKTAQPVGNSLENWTAMLQTLR
jgi:predicted nucleotide-binding protein (sugar kinase/HSP70/actin superfamily)